MDESSVSGIQAGMVEEDRTASAVGAYYAGRSTNENVENYANSGGNGEEEDGSEQEGTSKLDFRDMVSLGRDQYQRQYHPLTQPDCDDDEEGSQSVRNDEEEEEEEKSAGGGNEDSAPDSSSSVAAALGTNNDEEDATGYTMMEINETEEDGRYGRLLTQAEGGGDDSGDSISNDEFDMPVSYYSNGSISDRQQHDDSDSDSDDENEDSDNAESGESKDDASSSSGSSSSSDESASLEQDLRDMETTPRIVRNRRRAIKRNEERLRVLMQGVDRPGGKGVQENGDANNEGSRISGATKKRKRRKVGRSGVKSPGREQQSSGRRRGMLFATRFNSVESVTYKSQQQQQQEALGQSQGGCCLNAGGLLVNGSVEAAASAVSSSSQRYKTLPEEVCDRFPHREAQIRLLCSIFERTVQQGSRADSAIGSHELDDMGQKGKAFVPSPVFVTGPSGVGKTSVVRDILQTLKQRHGDVALTMSQHEQQPSGNPSSVAFSYVNCSTSEGSTAGAFLEEAYKQILRSFFFSSDKKLSRRSRKRRKRGTPRRRHMNGDVSSIKSHGGNANDQSAVPSVDNHNKGSPMIEKQGLPAEDEIRNTKSSMRHVSRHIDEDYGVDRTFCHDDEEEGFGDIEDQIEQQKKEHLRSKATLQGFSGQKGGAALIGDSSLEMKRHHTISTPADFGRALIPLCGGPTSSHHGSKTRYRGCAFLVLDHAERLLSMTAKQSSPYSSLGRDERNNLLSQLLLLPRVMGLNLTIVVVTNNSLLEFGRTNNIHLQPSASLGTIQDAIHPIRVRFYAYRGRQIYRSIFLLPKMKEYVFGCDDPSAVLSSAPMCHEARQIMMTARDRLYKAMIKAILQSLEGMTRDIREMQRFARIFWPIYISPLTRTSNSGMGISCPIKQKFCSVLTRGDTQGRDSSAGLCHQDSCGFCRNISSGDASSGGGAKIESVLEMLDIKGRKPMRDIMSKCLFTPVQKLDLTLYPQACADSTHLETIRSLQSSSLGQLSYMAKFLLVSAYLCQNNRQEQDLALFTNHNKGRRGKGRARNSGAGGTEEALYASSAAAQQQLRSLRPSAFPVERMASVFSSILSKYGTESELLGGEMQEDGYLDVSRIGSVRLFECLAELRDFGLLRDVSGAAAADAGNDPIDLSARKFICNLSDADALTLAKEVNIPLQKYMLRER